MQLTFHTPHAPKAGLRRSDQRTAPQLPSISNQPCFASERTMQTAPVPYCAFLTSQRNHALIIFFFKKANVVIQEKALLQEPILMASPILKPCPVCPQKSALETTGAGPVTGFLRSPRRCLSLTVAPRLVGGEWLLSSLRAAVCRELRPAQRSAAQRSPAQPSGSSRSCPRSGGCVCVSSSGACSPGTSPHPALFQSSLFLQEAAHLPLPPPLGRCELLSSSPLTPFQGSLGVSPFPGLLTLLD